LEDLALEHGGGLFDRQAWGAFLVDAFVLQVAGDRITRTASVRGRTAGCDAARASLHAEGRTVAEAVEREAARVEAAGISGGPAVPGADLAVPATLDDCLTAHAHDGLAPALGLVWVHEWLALVADRER
jgi:hypothetical protein